MHNLVCDPPFSRIDLVSCRNLLIYLTNPLQSQVFRLFQYALNPGGLLFLGQAESVEQHRELFADVDRDARLFRALEVRVRGPHFPARALPASPGQQRLPSRRQRAEDTLQERVEQAALEAFTPPSLAINAQDDLVYAIGQVNPFMAIRQGAVGTHITGLLKDEFRAEVRALLFKCRRENRALTGALQQLGDGEGQAVRISARPLPALEGDADGGLTLLSFERVAGHLPSPAPSPDVLDDPLRARDALATLQQELASTRESLQTVVQELETTNEELQSLNEELQSSNEELQSTNEELQTANEELQSTNEELLTVNDELQAKSRELERAMADIQNIVESSTSPLLVVERDLRIRRFVKSVDCVIPVDTVHVGDLITALPWRVDIPNLRGLLSEVIQNGTPRNSILSVGDQHFAMQVTPYRGVGQEIEGAVLWFSDVSELATTRNDLERSERYLSTVVDNVVDGIMIIDERGWVQTVNPAVERIFGYPAADLVGRPMDIVVPEEHRRQHQGYIDRYLTSGERRVIGRTRQLTGRRSTGEVFPLELGVSEILFQGQRLFCGIIRDVSQRVRAQEQLDRIQRKAAITLQCISDAIITLDDQGLVDYLNPVAEELTGVPLEKARGMRLAEVYQVYDPATRERVLDVLAGLQGGGHETATDCLLLVNGAGRESFVEQSVAPIASPEEGRSQGTVLAFRDVSSRRRMLEKITWQARHDPLTGLVNRVEFEGRLDRAVQSAKAFQRSHALLYLDLDQFKVINDTCGHRAGDDFLRQLTGHLCVQVRQRDTIARLGGDEFGVLLENCSLAQGQQIAGKLRETIHAFRFTYEDRVFKVGASVGVVVVEASVGSAVDVLRMADEACYSAKQSGRNRVLVYRPDDADLMQQRNQMDWITRLNAAVDDHRLRLYFQPIKPMKSADERHWEVLVRMVDPSGAIVLPGVFLPAAERYGLISQIDRWVVGETLKLLSESFPPGRAPRVSINLSAASMGEQAFHQFACDQVRACSVSAERICFEITETAAITNIAVVRAFMAEMKKLGCKFALDDFGSGMCSYGYLRTLPADFLKIDGVFIKEIINDAISLSMVESINRIGQLMNLATIAECAEDDATVAKLQEIGVDFVQGFALGRPVPVAEFLQRV
ncbi:MAG: EAL domain-containing protein [Proteobacteria bacterium]|nr:EAL domain-containing protein [Pseudomonadota bacterium]